MDSVRNNEWLQSSMLSEDERRRQEALALGVPFVVLTRDDIDIEALLLIPEPLSRTNNSIAYRVYEGDIEVALLDISTIATIQSLLPGRTVRARLTDRGTLKQALLIYQKHLKDKFAGMLTVGEGAIQSLVNHALYSGTSAVHIEPAGSGVVVRYRIKGALHEAMRLPNATSAHIVDKLKSNAKLFPVTTTVQEGSFEIVLNDEPVVVSVHTTPGTQGEKVVLRLRRPALHTNGFSLQSLGLHGDGLEKVHAALERERGALIVSGMDESGKTTCAYTMLEHLSHPSRALHSVEERIDHSLPHITQSKTRPDLGLTVPALLRATLRQDPDVVLVGTMEEGDTAEVALKAAQRGVTILGCVKARSSVKALDVLTQHAPSLLVAATVHTVVATRLLRKLRPHDFITRPLTREEGSILEEKIHFAKVLAALKKEHVVHEHISWKDIVFYTEASGYDGFTGIQEVLVVTPTIQSLLSGKADPEAIEAQAREEGMLTLLEDALFKAVQGLVSIEDVVAMAAE